VSNSASGAQSAVAGGELNVANAEQSALGGGFSNTAGGRLATVPGGTFNQANGDFSLAAGRRAQALHDGAFVWADSTNGPIASTADDQFIARSGVTSS